MKAHIHTKRRQFTEITRITDNLNEDEILIHLDYSKNYKCQHQNEIESGYLATKHSVFLLLVRIINKMGKFKNYSLRLPRRRKTTVEGCPCLVSIKSSHIPLIKLAKQSQIFTLSATVVQLNFVRDLCSIS